MPPTREIDSNFYLREKNTEKLEAGMHWAFKKRAKLMELCWLSSFVMNGSW